MSVIVVCGGDTGEKESEEGGRNLWLAVEESGWAD